MHECEACPPIRILHSAQQHPLRSLSSPRPTPLCSCSQVASYYGLPLVSTRGLFFRPLMSRSISLHQILVDESGVHPTPFASACITAALVHLFTVTRYLYFAPALLALLHQHPSLVPASLDPSVSSGAPSFSRVGSSPTADSGSVGGSSGGSDLTSGGGTDARVWVDLDDTNPLLTWLPPLAWHRPHRSAPAQSGLTSCFDWQSMPDALRPGGKRRGQHTANASGVPFPNGRSRVPMTRKSAGWVAVQRSRNGKLKPGLLATSQQATAEFFFEAPPGRWSRRGGVMVSYLVSYESMGIARFTCLPGCRT